MHLLGDIFRVRSLDWHYSDLSCHGSLPSLVSEDVQHFSIIMGPWMGGSPCRMSNLRNANVACLCR